MLKFAWTLRNGHWDLFFQKILETNVLCATCVAVCVRLRRQTVTVRLKFTDIALPSSRAALVEKVTNRGHLHRKSALSVSRRLGCLLNICALKDFFLKKQQHKHNRLSLKLRSTMAEVTVCCEMHSSVSVRV